ncbi:septum formation family protein [Gordonia sihwensis]|uniref:septum formation family protein n=1 Tax=Gordonia TaxID=2053 RepID=UPI0024161725|nr:septum formation family protein [Gordonia sihwensis]WFN92973.1 septum formation family protein [Gordonia sihwensis]
MHDGRGDDEARPVVDGDADVWGPVGAVEGDEQATAELPEIGGEPEPTAGLDDYDAEVEDDVEEWGVEPEDAYDYGDAGHGDDGYGDDGYGDGGERDGDDGGPEPADGREPADSRNRMPKNSLRLVLGAVLVGALAAGGVMLGTGVFDDVGDVGSSVIGEGSPAQENDFTRSEAGDCLTWSADTPGEPSAVACESPHRFEVAGVLDTSAFPSSEFSSEAPWPGPERFAAIRDESCGVIVDRYLGGGLDPQGRLSPGLMFPSKVEWERGVRSLRCGIEQPGAGGGQEEFTGRVRDVDQSFAWPDGTCIGIDKTTRKATSSVVNCAEPHAFQVTGTVDLSQRFGGRNSGKPWPSVADQNDYLKTICPTQTNRFFGGAQKFKATTLNVQWSVISEVSWLTGSRRVVCYAALPDRGGFATLVGDARGGPDTLLINGGSPKPVDVGPPGRSVGEPVPLPPGYTPNDAQLPAPAGG